MSHRFLKLLEDKGGTLKDVCGLVTDFGSYNGNENDRIKNYPVTLKVRTGKILDHWLFGRIVMDFKGMEWHKDKLLLDWAHDPNVEIGVIESHEYDSGDLLCKARLISRHPEDRVAKTIDYASQGVPYEVSMTWGKAQDGSFVVEEVPPGKEVVVNDKQGVITGPCTIIRVWGMYGAAICHHGVDSSTFTQFDSKDKKGTIMPKDLKVFTDKFGAEKAVEYMLNDSITSLEDAEKAHKLYLDAKAAEEQRLALDAAKKQNEELAAENARLKEDAAKAETEAKAKAEAQAKAVEDAKAKEEQLARYQAAMPGVNLQADAAPTGPTVQTDGTLTNKSYTDAMQGFFDQEYGLKK